MATAIVEAVSKLDTALVAKFSMFDGVMRMDEDGHHPPVSTHGRDVHGDPDSIEDGTSPE